MHANIPARFAVPAMTHLNPNERLVSVAEAALTAAAADAASANSDLTFRKEWLPAPRTRGSLSQPPRPHMSGTGAWGQYIQDRVVEVTDGMSRVMSPGPDQRRPVVQPLSRSTSAPISELSTAAPGTVPQPGGGEAPSSVSGSAARSPPALPASAPILPSPASQPNLEEGAVGELLRKNKKDYESVINHAFPRAMGEGTASLDGFRYYMLQDRLYLQMCAGLKMLSASGTRNYEAFKAFAYRHESSIDYVTKLEHTCTTLLGITESMMKETKVGGEIDASGKFYDDTLCHKNRELGYYVALLPCVLTYWAIANRLMNDPSTVKNVVYHSAWTEVNDDDSSVFKYIKFINENIASQGGLDEWSYIFRIACKLEADVFDTGLNPQAPAPYKVIDDGRYSINLASGGFVLAIRDVADVAQQRSNKSLASNRIVGMKGTGASEEKWQISSTRSGYTIQNIRTRLYLASKEKIGTGRVLQATAEPYYWWINPVKTTLGERSSRYQIYDTANLRFTLHTDIEMAGSNESNYISVVAHENTQSSSQMWTFDDGVERPAETTQTFPIDSQIAPAPAPANTGISAEHFSGELNKLTVQHDREIQELRAHFGAEMTSLAKKHETEMDALRHEMANTVSRAIKAMKDETKAEIAQLIEYHEHRAADAPDVGPEQQQTTPDSGDDEQDTKHGFSKLSSRVRVRPCHWERVTRDIFRAADYLHHIRYGVAPSRYIMRVQTGKSSWSVTDVGQGESCETDAGNREAWILVGHQPSLRWVSCHGRFKADSTGADLIPAWDSDSKGGPETMYIAMFTHAGRDYITHVKEGQNGVTKSINDQKVLSSKDYEVLSYKLKRRE